MSKGTEKPEKTEAGTHPATPHKENHPDTTSAKGKRAGPVPGGCTAWDCKKDSRQFGFCPEHFDHFKFGLIKKTGEPALDYEKKLEHYQAYVARQRAHKVA